MTTTSRAGRPLRAIALVTLVTFGFGCGIPGADPVGAPPTTPTNGVGADGADGEEKPVKPVSNVVHRGEATWRYAPRYRLGRDSAWSLRLQEKRSLVLSGRPPFVEQYDAVFRVERRGVSPEGYFHFAFALVGGTKTIGANGPRPLEVFAGLRLTTAFTSQGSWMESRWEVPPNTPPAARRMAERLVPKLYFSFPAPTIGPGASWENERVGPTTNLKEGRKWRERFHVVEIDDDTVWLEVEQNNDEPASRIVVADSGPVEFERGPSVSHAKYTIRLDRLVGEATSVWTRRSPLTSAGPSAVAVLERERHLSTVPDAPPDGAAR